MPVTSEATQAANPGSTTFEPVQPTFVAGSIAYLWSDAANWSAGLPQNGGEVVVGQPIVPRDYDDIANLSLSVLNLDGGGLAPGNVAVAGTLTIASLLAPQFADGSVGAVFSDTLAGAANALLTIGSITGKAEIAADGAGAVTNVLAATDTGEYFDVASGGELELSARPDARSSFTYDTRGSGVFAFRDAGGVVTSRLQTVSAGDAIALPGRSVSSVVYGPSSITVTTDLGVTSFTNVGFFLGLEPSGFTVGADPSGLLRITFGCFASGTRIATPDGEVAVEDLQVGDPVSTQDGARDIVWLGHRRIDVRHLPDPEAGWLVRIRAGAFADRVPRRDLLITQEHCVFIDGRLVPVRMLVNGVSIALDRTIPRYTYHHVELAAHGILFAEGLPTESYLDTGNRGNFANAETVSIRPVFAAAAAPVTVDRAFVEPVWHRLAGRDAVARRPLETDPDIRIVTEAGFTIRPDAVTGTLHSFLIPPASGALRLVSRASRPSDVIGPFVDDRRRLGVAVAEIVVDGEASWTHLDAKGLAGWHAPDATRRWTDGNALLPLDDHADPVRLLVNIVAAGPYLADVTDRPTDAADHRSTTLRASSRAHGAGSRRAR